MNLSHDLVLFQRIHSTVPSDLTAICQLQVVAASLSMPPYVNTIDALQNLDTTLCNG